MVEFVESRCVIEDPDYYAPIDCATPYSLYTGDGLVDAFNIA